MTLCDAPICSSFNPRAPCGTRQDAYNCVIAHVKFQSTRPVRDATLSNQHQQVANHCFNPRAPCGTRQSTKQASLLAVAFQSTRPVRDATSYPASRNWPITGFNPRAPCGTRLLLFFVGRKLGVVSIHAPRAGRDRQNCHSHNGDNKFQSTRPVRDATIQNRRQTFKHSVSIHAPRAGRDLDRMPCISISQAFQSTRPVRDATILAANSVYTKDVSIHAPRAGRDPNKNRLPASQYCFNPRAPCGTRHANLSDADLSNAFQSTRPVRDATNYSQRHSASERVSIHAPRAGRDSEIA